MATVVSERARDNEAPKSNWGRARERLAWILVAPSLLIVAGVAIYPLFQAFRLSLTDTNINRPGEPSYVWFENYRYLFDNRGNPGFLDALLNTFKFTFTSVALETIFGMCIALIIHSNFKGRGAVRTAMLVPWAIPTVVSSRMWQWMLHDNYGVINDLLVNKLGILDEKVAFLSNASTALPSIIAVDVWKTTPFMALLLLAAHWLDYFWQAAPTFDAHLSFHPQYVATLAAVGGLWLWLFVTLLKRRPILPVKDPYLPEALADESH